MHLTYDIHRTWEENCERGPSFEDILPDVPMTPMKTFLGLPVRSRIGIAAGVLGRAIHQPSVDIVRAVRQCIDSEGLKLEVAAVGGVSTHADVGDFFEAGADAVLCGSSPMYVPDLAVECKRLRPEW